MAVDLEKLNSEQTQAVTHQTGPLLIVAGAGTGKTTVITDRIVYLIEKGLAKPEEILAVTFTEKAATEMEERVDRALPFGYFDLWISTFHSFAERILKDNGLDVGLPTDFKLLDGASAWILMRQNLDKFNLKYYKPLGNPSRFIKALLDHFSKCKDQMIYPQDYLEYADALKASLNELPEDSEEARVQEIAEAYHVYQQLLLENNCLDFGDLINYCLWLFQKRPLILQKYQSKFKYILVDEFQDTNKAQYELIKLLAQPKNNLTVTADDDQCLPGDVLVSTSQGEKSIKNIKVGEEVLTAVGKGHIGISKVLEVSKKEKQAKIITIKTKKGFEIKATDNHKMFCFVPQTHNNKKFYYVYLMHRQDIGWRMGVTNALIIRIRLERSADKILAVKAFNTEVEARYYETLWSLKYGIPTSCFQVRKSIVIKDDLLVKLYHDLTVDENVDRLAQDLNIDLNAHHFALDAVNRGNKVRIKINIRMCHRNYRSKSHTRSKNELLLNPAINHQLSLETSDKLTIKKMQDANFSLRKTKNGMKFKIENLDIKEIGKVAKKIQLLTGGIIETKFNLALQYPLKDHERPRSYPAIVIPAKNLVLGHYLPVKQGREIVYDEIIEIKEENKNITVYDLEIDQTHNFFANGIVVHNSIYKWRGASVSNIMQFKKDFPQSKEIFLVKNYRSGQDILDLSYKFIQANNPNRLEYISQIDKKLQAQNGQNGFVKYLHFKSLSEEATKATQIITELLEKNPELSFNDFVILVRANNSALPFVKAIERAGLSYQFLASQGLYQKPIILDVISYLKLLDNYHESLALYRVLSLPFLEINNQDIMLITQESYKSAQSLYETLAKLSLVKGISQASINKITFLLSLITKHTEMAKTKPVNEVLAAFLNNSGYLKYLTVQDKLLEIDLLAQFYKKAKSFAETSIDPLLKSFLTQLNWELEGGEQGKLEFDVEQGPESIKIMTVHSAKGLEFKYVLVVGLVDKRFPSIERKDAIEIPDKLAKEKAPEGDIHLQEERRLFYVAMTRAKQGLFLTSASNYGGKTIKKPSQFLIELGLAQKILIQSGKDQPFADFADLATNKEKQGARDNQNKQYKLPEHFSFTQLAAFNNCPYQYKLAHILKVPIKGRASFSFGKTIH
ncbi:MAG: UvrD-helicase domain-containing protein, partial [Candidatus Pacebacteria bacterium]|nr:UvrD-helicase domain-containing protein [Candidatus Paceibacterota bacterium]